MNNPAELPLLSSVEARLLGCLIEKKELTPDIYPMTLNALQAAANQKTAREPVMVVEPAEVKRGLALLEQKGLVRQMFASRVERYEHLMAQRFSTSHQQTALLGLLLLRGLQTAHELLARSERMARFKSVDELKESLDLLIGRRPPLVQHIERGPGQREDRYAHLLSGPVEAAAARQPQVQAVSGAGAGLEARVEALEAEVAELRALLEALAAKAG